MKKVVDLWWKRYFSQRIDATCIQRTEFFCKSWQNAPIGATNTLLISYIDLINEYVKWFAIFFLVGLNGSKPAAWCTIGAWDEKDSPIYQLLMLLNRKRKSQQNFRVFNVNYCENETEKRLPNTLTNASLNRFLIKKKCWKNIIIYATIDFTLHWKLVPVLLVAMFRLFYHQKHISSYSVVTAWSAKIYMCVYAYAKSGRVNIALLPSNAGRKTERE